jgi:putative ATP-binding cassette transporter
VVGVTTYYLSLLAGVKRQRLERDKEDQLYKHFHGETEGIQELKIRKPRREGFFAKLRRTAEEFRDLRVSAQRIFIVGASWGNLLFFIVVGLVVFWGSTLDEIDRPVLSGYVLVLLYILGPLQMILLSIPNMTRANVALEKIERLGLNLLQDAEESMEIRGELAVDWQKLELSGVEHSYHHVDSSSRFTLGPMDLDFRPGELVFLIGGNGSGKTTLAKLLIGLYAPEKGELRFDGRRIDDNNREEYRNLFSVVFSNFFLFEDLLGLESPDLDEKAKEYLKKLQLHNKVRVKNGRFSTVDLSQGQRKRLALLHAALDDRPIFLFDEWAADQDPEFKKVFYHQILPELKARGKTVLVISHDDAYYGVGDRVIKLDYGQVIYDLPVEKTPFAGRSPRPATTRG